MPGDDEKTRTETAVEVTEETLDESSGRNGQENLEILSEISPGEDQAQIQNTLREMYTGIVVLAVVLTAIFLAVQGKEGLRFASGVILGAGTAGLMLSNLYKTIDLALDMEEAAATKYMKKKSVFRLLMAGAALSIALLLPKIFQVFGTLAGLFTLKFAAYLQPLTHKVLQKINKGR